MRLSIGASVVVILLMALPATAETVHFRSATTPPTPLQQRLAQEGRQQIAVRPSIELTGELYRPAGDGPFPAVVALHGCNGRSSLAAENAHGARFTALGYVLLIVDSFGPRGVKERCVTEFGPPPDRVMDAYGALLYLAHLPFVDPERIAVIGYSQGGGVALSAVTLGYVESSFDHRFRAAIAYYPPCEVSTGAVSAPTLILIGELDEWTQASACRELVAQRNGHGAPIRLVVYPGAHHAFDAASLRAKPRTFFGFRLEYNEAADRAAWTEAVAALRSAFGR